MSAPTPRIQVTKNYRLFKLSQDNRPLDLNKHKNLMASMQQYGFLPSYPVIACRDKDGNLQLRDGQHRLAIAETLALPVYWVEEKTDFDVAIVNNAQKGWQPKDYALKFSANGSKDYEEGLELAERFRLPLGTAFALLAGTISFSNISEEFHGGTFKVKERKYAESVASLYAPLVAMNRKVNNKRLIEACMASCRAEEFDIRRLLANAERCREKLVPYSTRDAYLEMLEDIYNFGRKQIYSLKNEAVMAMRKRNVGAPKAESNGKHKAQ